MVLLIPSPDPQIQNLYYYLYTGYHMPSVVKVETGVARRAPPPQSTPLCKSNQIKNPTISTAGM